MKKALGLFFLVISMVSCDDGEITLNSFDFANQTVQKCTDKEFLFKTKNDELLLISLSETTFNANFINEETLGTPREITLGGSNAVIYRKYSSNVNNNVICDALPPASPSVEKEWVANGGTLLIETNAIFANDGITITSYTHNITFENISFVNGSESFSFTSYIFGDYVTSL